MQFDERKCYILQAIVEDYICTAVPVGSRSIAKREDINLSSATIRNEMSDLEELGFLIQPHTSAGRIPSAKAYRFYVDRLMKEQPMSRKELEAIYQYTLKSFNQTENLIDEVANVLAEITQYPSLVMAPQPKQFAIRRVQLVDVGNRRLMAVIVTDAGTVHDRLIRVNEDVSEEQLEKFSKVISEALLNHSFEEAIQVLSREFRQDVHDQKIWFDSVLQTIQNEVDGVVAGMRDIKISGTTNLFRYPEYNNVEKARAMLTLLEEKEVLSKLLEKPTEMQFSIRIGPENEDENMNESSIVTATYHVENAAHGVFGIIGPTRMDYRRMLVVLNCVGQCMDELLSGNIDDRK